jgi:hypothetical protein
MTSGPTARGLVASWRLPPGLLGEALPHGRGN